MRDFRNRSVDTHQFAMVPRADIPRSSFVMETAHKTTFDAGYLIPVYVDEVLPGDSFNLRMTAFVRLATPIYPIMDNIYLESFFFFVPCRLVWENWQKFMGEDEGQGSTTYTIPQVVAGAGGFTRGEVYDYMGLPTLDQAPAAISVNALPLRAYNVIYNEWFRDENAIPYHTTPKDDGPDNVATYALRRRGKRHDYFTSCLPFVQKGTAVTLPLGVSAPVMTSATGVVSGAQSGMRWLRSDGANPAINAALSLDATFSSTVSVAAATAGANTIYPSNLYADLSAATSATINQLRQAFQIQKLLERDARGGTRYTEIVRAHFGVVSPDARLQRPEYLGGGSTPINVSSVPQTSSTDATTPQGNLAAVGTGVIHGHGFSQSFSEHGYIIGIVSVRADLSYQQGLRKMWSRETRYDFYFPVFAALGEQAVLRKEIYMTGVANDDDTVFGYQERWGEYRYHPSLITNFFRSTHPQTLDAWHLSQHFTAPPTLNTTFMREFPPIERIVAAGAEAAGQQFLFDSFFEIKAARPMPLYGVPGLVDHF